MTISTRVRWVILTAAVLLPAFAGAQQGRTGAGGRRPVRRRQAAIEIRGQVPTPQVVTVRPREVPTYSRQVLVPNFYDHDFWPAILPGYELVPRRVLNGAVTGDTVGVKKLPSDSVRAPGARAAPDSAPRAPGARAAPDSAPRPPGMTPARSSR
ncbi:MAG: hypothetical protein NVS9B3_06940 [Gemmatimonadaceae bacterium]